MQEEVKKGYKRTEIGVIPEEWRIEKIGDLTEIKTGGTPSKKVVEYWEGGDVPWMLSGDINKEIVREVSGAITKLGIENSAAKILPKSTVMIALNGQGKTKGKVAYLEIETSCNQSLAGILPNPKNFYSRYLYYHLQNRYEEIRGLAGDGARNGLNLGLIKEIKIILPNILEQQKIASILSTVDEHIEETDKLIEKTKELKKGLMQKLLTKGIGHTEFKRTEIGEIPKEWEVKKISDVVELQIGGTPSRKIDKYWDRKKKGKNIWVSIKDLSLVGKYIDDSSEYISDLGVKHSNVKKVKKNTVIMSFKLTIGKTAITKIDLYTNEAIAAFNINNDKILNYNYLFYVLPNLKYDTDIAVKGATLNKQKIYNTYLPMPPLKEQQKIASILSEVDSQIEQYEAKKEKLQSLKKGLMQQLLTGKIRVKV